MDISDLACITKKNDEGQKRVHSSLSSANKEDHSKPSYYVISVNGDVRTPSEWIRSRTVIYTKISIVGIDNNTHAQIEICQY